MYAGTNVACSACAILSAASRTVRSSVEGLEDLLQLGGRKPRALVDDADDRLFSRRRDADVHDGARRRIPERVLDQVGDRPLDLAAVHLDDRRLADDLDPIRRVEGVHGLADEVAEVPRLELR
jgi:hypothetical protein